MKTCRNEMKVPCTYPHSGLCLVRTKPEVRPEHAINRERSAEARAARVEIPKEMLERSSEEDIKVGISGVRDQTYTCTQRFTHACIGAHI
jgi:hypothetical protein